MKLGRHTASMIMLSCTMALLVTMISPAFGGAGCGINPLGDTSGDKDFYVSKNQNQGTSSGTNSASTTQKPVLALGSTAKANQSAVIQSLEPDTPGPQIPGTSIVWIASAANTGNEDMLFDFLLKGPSTEGQQKDLTGWTPSNTWTWNSTDLDLGENVIEVRVKRASSNNTEDSKSQSYTIVAAAENNQDAANDDTTGQDSNATSNSELETFSSAIPVSEPGDSHPDSKTSEIMKTKPRTAPDESKRTPSVSTGPNMDMPDPSPKSQAGTATAETAIQSEESQPIQTYVEPKEPEVMQVDGKWTVKLEDIGSLIDLIVIQSKERISGSGTLNEGSKKIPIIAKGSVSENSITLEVQTVVGEYVNKIDKRIYLDLVKVDRVISGSYEAYSGEDLTSEGNVTASRFGQ